MCEAVAKWLVPHIFTLGLNSLHQYLSPNFRSTHSTRMTLNSEMSDMTLWCLLKGKDSTFRVVTSPTIFIDELKKLIENKIQTHIPSYELKLWKVC